MSCISSQEMGIYLPPLLSFGVLVQPFVCKSCQKPNDLTDHSAQYAFNYANIIYR